MAETVTSTAAVLNTFSVSFGPMINLFESITFKLVPGGIAEFANIFAVVEVLELVMLIVTVVDDVPTLHTIMPMSVD